MFLHILEMLVSSFCEENIILKSRNPKATCETAENLQCCQKKFKGVFRHDVFIEAASVGFTL